MAYRSKKNLLFIVLSVSILFLSAGFVFAFEATYPPVFGITLDKESGFAEYAKYFFNIGMALAGLLAVGVIAFGGLHYLISLGIGRITDEGKEWLKAGILGLIITVSSYLIAYTINPNLVVFNLNKLPVIGGIFEPSSSNPTGPPFLYFNEIPVGTLTENLLSREMDCYDFDANGDPIEQKIKLDNNQIVNGPTLLKHDRVDCLFKLSQAVERKSNIITKLSEEIAKMMDQCKCGGDSVGSAVCTEKPGPGGTQGNPWGNTCQPQVKTKSVNTFQNCPKLTGSEQLSCQKKDESLNCQCNKSPQVCNNLCPPETVDKREHGPIRLEGNLGNKEFKGLDEFRIPDKRKNIVSYADFLEIPAQKDGRILRVINNGNCETCELENNCELDDESCLEKYRQDLLKCLTDTKRIECIKKGIWYDLTLREQLLYLREKMVQIEQKIKEDLTQVQSAEARLGQCYLAESYVDFLKTEEKIRKEDRIVSVQKSFNDSETQKPINVSNYCEGFEYANSSSYSFCQEVCPEESAAQCYKQCTQNPNCDTITNASEKAQCLENQKQCVQTCYNERKCSAPFQNLKFTECISSFNQKCQADCNRKYGDSYPEELEKCKEKCGNNSQCLLDNQSTCVVDFIKLGNCAKTYTKDSESFKNCVNNSYLAKYCSDQYAGYPDCLKPPGNLSGEYSASYIYENPSKERCSNPYQPINENGLSCITAYPETAKCPSSSSAPRCPCGVVDETITVPPTPISENFGKPCAVEGCINPFGSCVTGACKVESCRVSESVFACTDPWNSGECPKEQCSSACFKYCVKPHPNTCQKTGCYGPDGVSCSRAYCDVPPPTPKPTTITISDYRVCTGECAKDKYNDDPLTFYCQSDWWKREEKIEEKQPEPIGGVKVCSKEREIPVGQTVDDAEKWGVELIKRIDDFVKKTDDYIINYVKKVGDEKNYCKCDSPCEDGRAPGVGETACQAKCEYVQTETIQTDESGATSKQCIYSCQKKPCSGNPCQKIVNLLRGKKADESCPKNVLYLGAKGHQKAITDALLSMIRYITLDGRTDVVKELNYSRQKTNECSLIRSSYDREVKILSCERVVDEILSPVKEGKVIINGESIDSYCYGKAAGKILKTPDPVMDNWFCCENREELIR